MQRNKHKKQEEGQKSRKDKIIDAFSTIAGTKELKKAKKASKASGEELENFMVNRMAANEVGRAARSGGVAGSSKILSAEDWQTIEDSFMQEDPRCYEQEKLGHRESSLQRQNKLVLAVQNHVKRMGEMTYTWNQKVDPLSTIVDNRYYVDAKISYYHSTPSNKLKALKSIKDAKTSALSVEDVLVKLSGAASPTIYNDKNSFVRPPLCISPQLDREYHSLLRATQHAAKQRHETDPENPGAIELMKDLIERSKKYKFTRPDNEKSRNIKRLALTNLFANKNANLFARKLLQHEIINILEYDEEVARARDILALADKRELFPLAKKPLKTLDSNGYPLANVGAIKSNAEIYIAQDAITYSVNTKETPSDEMAIVSQEMMDRFKTDENLFAERIDRATAQEISFYFKHLFKCMEMFFNQKDSKEMTALFNKTRNKIKHGPILGSLKNIPIANNSAKQVEFILREVKDLMLRSREMVGASREDRKNYIKAIKVAIEDCIKYGIVPHGAGLNINNDIYKGGNANQETDHLDDSGYVKYYESALYRKNKKVIESAEDKKQAIGQIKSAKSEQIKSINQNSGNFRSFEKFKSGVYSYSDFLRKLPDNRLDVEQQSFNTSKTKLSTVKKNGVSIASKDINFIAEAIMDDSNPSLYFKKLATKLHAAGYVADIKEKDIFVNKGLIEQTKMITRESEEQKSYMVDMKNFAAQEIEKMLGLSGLSDYMTSKHKTKLRRNVVGIA